MNFFLANMTVNPELGNFSYLIHECNRSGENKTTFTWVDHSGNMTIISVDWIQKGESYISNNFAISF